MVVNQRIKLTTNRDCLNYRDARSGRPERQRALKQAVQKKVYQEVGKRTRRMLRSFERERTSRLEMLRVNCVKNLAHETFLSSL